MLRQIDILESENQCENMEEGVTVRYLIDAHLGIGDVIHIFPLLQTIEKGDKNANITIIVAFHEIDALFEQFESVQSTMTVSEVLSYGLLHARNYDYGLIAACVCNQSKSYLLLKSIGCRSVLRSKNRTKHRVEQNLELAIQMGFPWNRGIRPELQREVKRHLMNKRIGICMGGYAKAGKDYKRWSYGNWVKLINLIDEQVEVELIAGKKEAKEFEPYELQISRAYQNSMGKLSLEQSIEQLSQCHVVVGNDTGMMHVAGALSVPTVTLYGPTNPKIIGVYNKGAVVVSAKKDCCPCYVLSRKIKCKSPDCVNTIQVEEIMSELRKIIDL